MQMKLVVFNGSPRRKSSNSEIITEKFLQGYSRYSDSDIVLKYIAGNKNMAELVAEFYSADRVIIIFPLYTDSMPGPVKEFFEELHASETRKNLQLGFIVQSGFPESIHSEAVELYLKKFAGRIGCMYTGTVIRGGIEGIQQKHERMNQKLFRMLDELGSHYVQTGEFNRIILQKLRKPRKFNFTTLTLFRLLKLTGITNFYWNRQLRKNEAFERRFDQPYADKSG